MEDLFSAYDKALCGLCEAQQRLDNSIRAIVEKLQQTLGTPYVEFPDDWMPDFYNPATEEYEQIACAKIVSNTMLVVTDGDDIEDEHNWFVWQDYGELDQESFVSALHRVYLQHK